MLSLLLEYKMNIANKNWNDLALAQTLWGSLSTDPIFPELRLDSNGSTLVECIQ